jgi:DNA-binding response OmpR family regulator
LLAEDDEALAAFVRKGLEAEHYAVDVSRDGEQSLGLGLGFDYDLAILDLNLPRLDGVAILRGIRQQKAHLPILILTARHRIADRVECLDAGADDYVVKPFSFAELSARVRALLRRGRLPAESILHVEDLRLDRIERKVTRGGRSIELTSKEFALLEYLMRNTGRRVTRTMIIEHVWNATFDSTTNLVDVYIFGHWQPIDSLKGAVVSLGFQRLRDIVISCSILRLMPVGETQISPVVFWEHSLGCALISRHFARKIDFPNPDKAYLGGLLHDLGILVNLWVSPKEFGAAVDRAQREHVPLHAVELEMLGMTHCETGRILAERWGLPADLVEVVSSHHDAPTAKSHRSLVALVSLSDLLCRMGDIGHGYQELCQVNFVEEPAFAVLLQECPALATFDWARFTFELEGYLEEVRRLVHQLYGTS